MEAVGGVAATIQLFEVALKLANVIRSVSDKIQEGPEELERWISQIESLRHVLETVEKLPALADPANEPVMQGCRGVCTNLLAIFDGLEVCSGDGLRKKTWKAIKGLDQEEAIRKRFEELERFKATLILMIQVYSNNQDYAKAGDVKDLASAVQKMNLFLKPGPDEERCKRDLFDVLEIDPGTHPNKIVTDNGRKVQGTCEWVTESEKYLGWINSPSGLLWISGGPGKGKTFISVHTYQKLVEFPETTTICFFCDNKSVTRNSATKVLCGLIYQLVDKHPDLFPIMVPKWKTQDKLLFEEASFETQWRILESMLRSIKRQVYCVLDGLDECEEDSLRRLLFKIETIFQSNQQNDHSLKFVVLSRRHPSILEETLGAHPHLKLDPDSDTEVRHDVKLFISSRVKELATRRKIDNQLLISHIERVLQQKCENTFLWVSFMTKDLMSKSIPNIEEALEDLPTGIDEVYTRILLQIKPEDKAAISKLLLWIAFARRPLDLGTLAAAADIQDTKTLTKTEVCRGHVISCGHLLQWGRRGNHDLDESTKVTFVHQSAKDFMLCPTKDSAISDFKMAVGEGHMKIADLIVGYMEKNKRESKTYTMGEYSFKNYVIQYWPKYLTETSRTTPLECLVV
ncbi:hypothetical protein ACO1O0_000178 [Amphichorda felina]